MMKTLGSKLVGAKLRAATFALCVLTAAGLAGATLTEAACGTVPGKGCVIKFELKDPVSLSNLQFETNYSRADGEFDGSANTVVCGSALGGAFAAFRDKEEITVVDSAIIRLSTFTGPTDISACCFTYGSAPPVAGDFTITVTDAGRPGAEPGEVEDVRPLPKVRISAIQCPGSLPGGLTTTTTSTTTTTVSTSTTSSFSTTTTLGEPGGCGFPTSNGDRPVASDALYALQASVHLRQCDDCVCDVDSANGVVASDALAILRAAVGLPGDLICPPC